MNKESSKLMKQISTRNKDLFPLRSKRTKLMKCQKDNVAGFLEVEPTEIIGTMEHTNVVTMVIPEAVLLNPEQARKEFRLGEEEKEQKEEGEEQEAFTLLSEKDVTIQFFVSMEEGMSPLEASFSVDNILDGTTFSSTIPLGESEEEEQEQELKIKASFTSLTEALASVERSIEQIEEEVQLMKAEYQEVKAKEDEEEKQRQEEKKQEEKKQEPESSTSSTTTAPQQGKIHLSGLDDDEEDDDLELTKPKRHVMQEMNPTKKQQQSTGKEEEKEASSFTTTLTRWSTKGLQLAMIGGQLCLQFRFVWVFAFGFAFFHWKGDVLRF